MKHSYLKINDEIKEISSLIKIAKTITPLNDSSEQKKFLEAYAKGEEYNPQYRYPKTPVSIIEAKRRLLLLKDSVEDKKHLELISKMLLVAEFLQCVGKDDTQIYTNGKPSAEMVAIAKLSFPREKVCVPKKSITAKEAKRSFTDYLEEFNIRDWKVAIKKKMIAKSNVESSKKMIYLKDKNYSRQEINTLLAHEIGVHVLRAVNGQRNKNSIFSLGTADYLKTEEGLAIMMEQLTGNYNPLRFKFFASRIIAADLACTRSFYDVFDDLHKKFGVSKHNAYIITKRVKRGLKDTKNPGGYIKDHVYFEGFYMIKKFMQSGGDIRPLFAGKISLDEISLVDKGSLDGILIPKAVEAHYQYRSRQMVLY